MALITNPDGSHRFVMDEAQSGASFDVESLVQARQRPSIGQPLRPPEWNIQPLPGYPGVSYWQLVLGGEGRGVYRQRGTFDQGLSDFGEQTLVYDDYEIARLPFQFNLVSAPDPGGALGGRLYGSLFQGTYLIAASDGTQLFLDAGTGYYSNIANQAGFVPVAGSALIHCMRGGQLNGAPALYIGYNAGATYSLQCVTNLSPWTASLVPIGPYATYGLCQTPVDGDSLQVYTVDASGGIIKVINTNTTLGAAVVRDGVRLPAAGYAVGLVNLDGNPECFYVVPTNGYAFYDTGTGPWTPTAFRGKLMRVDLRALTVYPVATALDFVLYATAGDNEDGSGAHDIFYCNGKDHQYLAHGIDMPVLPAADRPPLTYPNYKRICRGHWYKHGRYYWEENLYDTVVATNPTLVQRFEYDPALGRAGVRPVSVVRTLSGNSGVQSMGSPNQPWSPLNNNLIGRTATDWLTQYQPSRSETGYGKRHVEGSLITDSPTYEASGYRRWPRLRPPGRPGALMAISRITGPPPANLRTGSGADASGDFHNTRVEVFETHTLPAAIFYGDDGVDADGTTRWRPAVDYPDNDAWTDELDLYVTAYRDDVAGMALHYTPNPGPVVVEGYLREIGAPPPSRNILNWGADRVAADDLSRPLL